MSFSNKKYHFLLRGRPGVGKTTLIQKIITKLNEREIPTKGFVTVEIRNKNKERIGFDIKSIKDNSVCPLARVETSNSRFKVGKYTVYANNLDEFALPLVTGFTDHRGVIIIDEIGKMESFSTRLFDQIENLTCNSNNIIISTSNVIGKPLPLVEKFIRNPKFTVIEVTRENRTELDEKISNEVVSLFGDF